MHAGSGLIIGGMVNILSLHYKYVLISAILKMLAYFFICPILPVFGRDLILMKSHDKVMIG